MRKSLLLELKNCINRNEFKFIFSSIFLLSIGSFAIACYEFYGAQATFIRSAYEMSIIQDIYSGSILQFIIILLPILATIIYSDSFYTEKQDGVYKFILTRTKLSTYVISKALAIFLITFLVFLVPLLINQGLSIVTFPLEGLDNNQALPPYDIGIQNYNSGSEYVFDFIRIQSPLLFNILKMIVISIFAACFSLLSYGIYFTKYSLKRGRFFTAISIFIVFIIQELTLSILGLGRYSISTYLKTNGIGNPLILIVWILTILLVSCLIIYRYGIKKNLILMEE